jgi:hypothetical protein
MIAATKKFCKHDITADPRNQEQNRYDHRWVVHKEAQFLCPSPQGDNPI